MTTRELLARRRACSAERGDDFLSDPGAQEDLQFLWNGSVLSDRCPEVAMDYFYPSTIGASLFFRGSFEAGEIAIAAALLAGAKMPVILDIGANIGLHTVRWCQALPGARVFAAEPVPRNQLLLERNIARSGMSDRVHIVPAAFGAECGTVSIYESADAAYSSARATNAQPVLAHHDVPRFTIDSFVAERSIARVDLMKIDVEGDEFSVLEGAAKTIERDAPCIVAEISEAHSGERADERIAAVLAMGYQAYLIDSGIVTAYRQHDDPIYNYLFIHPRSGLPAPQTAADIARDEIGDLAYLHRRSEQLLKPLQAELKAKDDEINQLKAAAEERLDLVNRLARELAVAEGIGARLEGALGESRAETQALREQLAEVHARVGELELLANERLEVLQALHHQRRETEAPK